jgi:hypothetical protein
MTSDDNLLEWSKVIYFLAILMFRCMLMILSDAVQVKSFLSVQIPLAHTIFRKRREKLMEKSRDFP